MTSTSITNITNSKPPLPALPLLRLKRTVHYETPETVHVRIKKRRRLSSTLDQQMNTLTLSPRSSSTVTNTTTTCPEKMDTSYVVFRRMNENIEAMRPVIVDVDSQYVRMASTSASSSSDNRIEKNKKDDDVNDYVMFEPTERIDERDNEDVRQTEEKNDVAFVDAEQISELNQILDLAFEHCSEDEEHAQDDSDLDARTVDYPSTPEEYTDEDDYDDDDDDDDVHDKNMFRRFAGEYDDGVEEEEQNGIDLGNGFGDECDNDDDDDYNDYERYEQYQSRVEYDSEISD